MNVEVPLGGLLFGTFMLGLACGFILGLIIANPSSPDKVQSEGKDVGDGKSG